jgi:LPXTG-site transpeptidase (sortase) family protein
MIRRTSLWVITALAALVFCTTLVHALWYAPEVDSFAPATPAVRHAVSAADQPARLVIPSLKIDANIQYVGVNGRGEMGVPNNFTDVAWYKYGTVPGELGSAVIDGHVDNGLGLDGVFKHLGDIQKGDDVYLVRKSGEKLHYKVTDVAIYPYKSVPTDLVFSQNDAARLNLITCDGAWVKNDKTYDERLVVYTELVS